MRSATALLGRVFTVADTTADKSANSFTINSLTSYPTSLLIDTDRQVHATLVITVGNDFDTANSLYAVLTADRQTAPPVQVSVIGKISDIRDWWQSRICM